METTFWKLSESTWTVAKFIAKDNLNELEEQGLIQALKFT
jgi:hypothetical protein